jgi:hypothetical protein
VSQRQAGDRAGLAGPGRRRLEQAQLPPSLVVSSGRGLHANWVLETPVVFTTKATAAQVAAANICLANAFSDVGADWTVANAARFMRLPGTSNPQAGRRASVSARCSPGS